MEGFWGTTFQALAQKTAAGFAVSSLEEAQVVQDQAKSG
jgi:hypothetical protein